MSERKNEVAKNDKKAQDMVILTPGYDYGNLTERDLSAAIDTMDAIEESNFVTLTGGYLVFEPNNEYRVIICGMTEISKINGEEGEMTPAVQLFDKERQFCINADSVLISAAKKLHTENRLPAMAVINHNGEKKGANGKYKDLQIKIVNVPKSAQKQN